MLYSNIINIVIRDDYRGKIYNGILLWSNYNLRRDKCVVMNEHFKF